MGNNSPAFIVDEAGVEHAQPRNLQLVEDLEISEVAVGSRDSGSRVRAALLPKVLRRFHSKAEEDLVIDVNLLVLDVHGVKGLDDLVNHRASTFHCGFDKIAIYFSQSLIPVELLNEVCLGERSENLQLFIPVAQAGDVESVQIQCPVF